MIRPRIRTTRKNIRVRLRAVVILLVIASIGSALGAAPVSRAAAQPSADLHAVLDQLSGAIDLADAARADADQATELESSAVTAEIASRVRLERAETEVADQRIHFADIGVAAYMSSGEQSGRRTEVIAGAFSVRQGVLDDSIRARRQAQLELDRATEERDAAERVTAKYELASATAEQHRRELEAEADRTVAGLGAADLPAAAYLAYERTADEINAAHPSCALPAALLAAMGRVLWRHGQSQQRAIGISVVTPSPNDPSSPYDLQRVITPVAEALCAGDTALDTWAHLQAALFRVDRDQARVDVILNIAVQYGRNPDLDLGHLPPRPATDERTLPQFDDAAPLAPGDLQAMLDWAIGRLGTPYSQCLGPDVRPQDPICPPGTNRFGSGFFDCSGFVSAAYRRIGITVPATTYAMEASSTFMATIVSDRLDPSVLRPGDVFLMDGHTGMYAGDGRIIHARGGGLTLEPIPNWVANATFAVMRPLELLVPSN